MEDILKVVWFISILVLGVLGYGEGRLDYEYSYLEAFIMSFCGVVIVPIGLIFHGTLPNVWFTLQFILYLFPLFYLYFRYERGSLNKEK